MNNTGLFLCLIILGAINIAEANLIADENPTANSTANSTEHPLIDKCFGVKPCINGIILPRWLPDTSLSPGAKAHHGTIYLLSLLYVFVGISMISEHFMAAIEVIVSQSRTVKVKQKDGEVRTINVKIWNETVSNLTLMALGTSAPEILLAIIQICGQNFEAGDLGPSTIVGSAAYNLFVITGICMLSVKGTVAKRIRFQRVFFITTAWSIFAYIWLYIIISVTSPGIIDVWEAAVTFLCFPIVVTTSWMVDRKMLFARFFRRKVRAPGVPNAAYIVSADDFEGRLNGGDVVEMQQVIDDSETGTSVDSDNQSLALNHLRTFRLVRPESVDSLHREQEDLVRIFRNLRLHHPEKQTVELQKMAEAELLKQLPRNFAYYRLHVMRQFSAMPRHIIAEETGITPEIMATIHEDETTFNASSSEIDPNMQRIFFEPDFYAVSENVGSFPVIIARDGSNLNNTVTVDVETFDGSAIAGKDYRSSKTSVTFDLGVKRKEVSIGIIRNTIYQQDEHFYVRLSNPIIAHEQNEKVDGVYSIELGAHQATVMILDEDHGGEFTFENPEISVAEDEGCAVVKVCRKIGARGYVAVPYSTQPGSAKPGEAYEAIADGNVIFHNNQTEQEIRIPIFNESKYDKNETFYVELREPHEEAQFPDNSHELARRRTAHLGEIRTVRITINESKELRKTIDRIARETTNESLVISRSPWKDRFLYAIKVRRSNDDDEDAETSSAAQTSPTCFDYFMHGLTVFWKVLFAFVPPTDYWHGWLCFSVSLLVIAILTTLICDLASMFGCTVGLKDSLTAISFLAVGTSLPDTFASRVAAIKDRYADASIGNVTGSNAVNVFLGIGVAWLIAAIVHAIRGQPFRVPSDSLAFSVTTFCSMAVLAIAILLLRRLKPVGGELGGPVLIRYLSAGSFFLLWISYLVLSVLQSYCVLPDF